MVLEWFQVFSKSLHMVTTALIGPKTYPWKEQIQFIDMKCVVNKKKKVLYF